MTPARLPDGFAVQVDRKVRVLGRGSTLLGGSPTRLLRLAPAAQGMLSDGRLEVRDAVSAQLARTLLDATVAHPRPAGGPSHRDVTVVIPVRDNVVGLNRLIVSLRGLRVVVVDDGSQVPVRAEDLAAAHCCEVEVLRHPAARGPAAARNTGLRACTTDFVAFLDSDVVPRRGWLEALLGHFCDPTVALVAPRIVGMAAHDHLVARYEAIRSSLDLGGCEAPVVPYGKVAYVPSAAIICRCSTLRELGGFDEALRSGEDVDLCWRLVDAGSRLRYEPIALVAHDHRVALRDWVARKAFYGGSAAPLSARHPDKTAPMVISGWALAGWALMALGSALGYLVSAAITALTGHRVARSMRGADTAPADVLAVTLRGLAAAGLQIASALCRHYWPIALLAACVSQRCRRVVLLAAVSDGIVDWLRHARCDGDDTRPLGLPAYLLLKRVDDLAYGAGLWGGVLRERNLAALKPQLRS
ncbi:mycofactocin biosynthesis glycosyltransferase MftF [Mycolicibacter senuensis]|uniref:Putative mycofactocin biosynthesis glycosyltransferase MftF n=1 Tax=Mycolicibacter senuensis TaxID=386913 RepID=A0A7I9XRE3_9MYCO|nr:mycofactocin biosynthesis glycosyltransferase MftF [Mycolicibacter senuensis]MDQ2627293.1 mycofactocin biosynthesis glycosyltransferase MftF [Actinomycetota bacterium]ORW64980.1 mycofactocin system glycosyltransferase [Mycolicibacter senuensis]GFG72572.1 putative mycofactocin biosynthesis glycosyltransferase MftF [Mycolicibacter senuensis]